MANYDAQSALSGGAVASPVRVDIDYERMNFILCRWLEGKEEDIDKFTGSRQTLVCHDLWDKTVCLFPGNWDLDYAKDKNPNLVFRSISQVN